MADCGSDQNSEQDCAQFATTMGTSQGLFEGKSAWLEQVLPLKSQTRDYPKSPYELRAFQKQ